MDAGTLQFLAFVAFSVASLIGGYVARRSGWMKESHAVPIHFHTVVWTWTAGAVLAMWRLEIEPATLWVVLIQALVTVGPALLIIPVAKRIGATRGQIGALAVGAGVCNIGYTLGGYLCFAMLEPGEAALGYAGAATSTLAISIILCLYPIALHFGELPSDGGVAKLMLRSLLNIKALPLYGAAAGGMLAAFSVPEPAWIDQIHLRDIVFYVLTFGSHLGIGLGLRVKGMQFYPKLQVVLAAFVFGVTPLLTWLVIGLSAASPMPMDPLARQVMAVEAFMPTGVSIVILANVFRLDSRAAVSLWLCNTAFFLALILPLIVVLA